VIAAGSLVMEHFELSGGIPLFVSGCGGTGTKDVLGSPTSNWVESFTNVRAAVMVTAYTGKLEFVFVDLEAGTSFYRYTINGRESQPLSFSVNYAWNSGFQEGSVAQSLELEPYGIASLLNDRGNTILNSLAPAQGGVVNLDEVPTPAQAAANPWLKASIIAVGDDPVRLFWWNKAKGDFTELLTSTFTGYSYYNSVRTKLATPTFTPEHSSVGTIIDHADSAVEMWVSEAGQPFAQMTAWPGTKLYLFDHPATSKPIFLAAFVRKAGFLDSDIRTAAFTV